MNANINDLNDVDRRNYHRMRELFEESKAMRFQLVRVVTLREAYYTDEYDNEYPYMQHVSTRYYVVDNEDKEAADEFYEGYAEPEYIITQWGIANTVAELCCVDRAVSAAMKATDRRKSAGPAAGP